MAVPVLRRVVRRETHSPRTFATVIVLLVVIAVALLTGVEIVLHMVGVAPLMVAPGGALAWLTELPDASPYVMVIMAGVVLAVVGLLLIWLALSPGRRTKHELGGLAHAVVVDNGVIASAVAQRLRRDLDLSRAAVVVGVGHRKVDITVRPELGQSIEKSLLQSISETELAGYSLTPKVRTRVRLIHRVDLERSA